MEVIQICVEVITTFLALVLTLNNFFVNAKFYLQSKGCAMGLICAPGYVHIYLNLKKNRSVR